QCRKKLRAIQGDSRNDSSSPHANASQASAPRRRRVRRKSLKQRERRAGYASGEGLVIIKRSQATRAEEKDDRSSQAEASAGVERFGRGVARAPAARDQTRKGVRRPARERRVSRGARPPAV